MVLVRFVLTEHSTRENQPQFRVWDGLYGLNPHSKRPCQVRAPVRLGHTLPWQHLGIPNQWTSLGPAHFAFYLFLPIVIMLPVVSNHIIKLCSM
jgi:hypothetical protein